MEYNDIVLDHFIHPRNMGEIEDADGIGEAGSAREGDVVRLTIRVEDGVITDVRFKTFGCGAAIASSSVATELIRGKSVEDALAITNEAIIDALGGLPEAKIQCSVLAPEALAAAVADYRKRRGDA